MTGRPAAPAEVRRILALVPWIMAHPGRPRSEIARRFGIGEAELDRDLGLILMIGVPPYTPGDYVDVDDEDGTVTIRLADYLRRPLRLTPAEGLALLAAGRALLAVPGSDPRGPLATALDKLTRTLDLAGVDVSLGEPPLFSEVRGAVERRERVEIEYWAAGRDEVSHRLIDPAAVFYAAGAWYVSAWCHRAGSERMFRLDRIRGLRPTGEHFEPAVSEASGPGGRPDVYQPGPDDPRVTLRLAPAAHWVAETYPAESVTERDDGILEVVLPVSERAWLERLLLRVGPAAVVVEPPAFRLVGPEAARRVLDRYRGGTSPSGRPAVP